MAPRSRIRRPPRPARAPRPRRLRRRRDRGRALGLLPLTVALFLGYLGGRWTAPAPVPGPPEATPTRTATVAGTATRAAGLCPCPEPRPKGKKRTTLLRRPVTPDGPPPSERPDPTEATGRALRAAAGGLGRCAPAIGERRPLHLEVEVRPEGRVDAVRVLNVDALPPPEVIRCVQTGLRAARLPPFDGARAVRFSLSLSL